MRGAIIGAELRWRFFATPFLRSFASVTLGAVIIAAVGATLRMCFSTVCSVTLRRGNMEGTQARARASTRGHSFSADPQTVSATRSPGRKTRNALTPELDIDRAADILWTLNHPDLWQLLVGQRGWTPEQYEQWCGDLACSQLLRRT